MIEIQNSPGQGAILNFKRIPWFASVDLARNKFSILDFTAEPTSHLPHHSDGPRGWQVGGFRLRRPGVPRTHSWPGRVTVASLETTSGGTYKWPTKEDVLDYPVEDILRILDDPVPVGYGSHIQLHFWLVDIRRVTPLRMACHATEMEFPSLWRH